MNAGIRFIGSGMRKVDTLSDVELFLGAKRRNGAMRRELLARYHFKTWGTRFFARRFWDAFTTLDEFKKYHYWTRNNCPERLLCNEHCSHDTHS